MRLRPIAVLYALCAFIGLAASPSQAQTPDERAALTRNALNCEDWYTAHRYTPSLAACTAAVTGFEQAAAIESNNPWYAYYMKATMLEYKAFDQSALGHHRASLRTAIESHRLASYVYATYRIDADDYRSINLLVTQLQHLEAQEQAHIRRGEGD
jgi:hypothetical protein